MTKKIAIIIERANIALGGAERSVIELAKTLNIKGFNVDVLAASGQVNVKNIKLLCGNDLKRVSFGCFKNVLRKYLQENSYDIIHSTLPFDFADIYQPRGGCYAEAITRNAASYNSRSKARWKKLTALANIRRTILLRAEKKLCEKPDGPIVAALSNYVSTQFKDHYGLKEERIALLHNGVKIDKVVDYKVADKLRAQILQQLKLKEADRPLFFLFAANNFRLKGLEPLIKAWAVAAAKKTHRNKYLIIAGRGSSRKYIHLARKLQVHRKIIFLGPIRHIQNALSIADVGILPTFYDPSSRFILETIAFGKPAITTKYNGAIDLLTPQSVKIIDEPGNIDSLADAINHFSNDDNIKNASEAIKKDNLKQAVSVDRVVAELAGLYETILEKSKESI